MDSKEILEKVSNKKTKVGEMEKEKINKSALISLLTTGVFAVILIIVEGIFKHFTSIYCIASLCFLWACVFYTLQYFKAKMPWQVLIGAILDGLAFIFFFTRYILAITGIWW